MGLIIAAYAIFALVDIFPIIRSRSWRCILVFIVLFVISLTLAILLKLKVKIPSILLFLGDILKSWHLTY
ncbi:MAG TPA: hypothetical protein GXZ52_03750 [Clostridiales bacterium]|nr:hypothetical protein [Clostridiales bacterium]